MSYIQDAERRLEEERQRYIRMKQQEQARQEQARRKAQEQAKKQSSGGMLY